MAFLNHIKLFAEDGTQIMNKSINIYFFWSSKSLSWFYFPGFIGNKFFRGNLMVPGIFSSFSFPFMLSHISHNGRVLADYINLPLSVYPVVACQSK